MYNDYLSSLDSKQLMLKRAEAALYTINAIRERDERIIRVAEMHGNGHSIEDIASCMGLTRNRVRQLLAKFAGMLSVQEKRFWEQDKRSFGNQILVSSGWHPIDSVVWSEDLGVSERCFENFKDGARVRGIWLFEELEILRNDSEKERIFKMIVRRIGMDAYQKLVDSAGIKK
jgi:hypothetical protein